LTHSFLDIEAEIFTEMPRKGATARTGINFDGYVEALVL
jgi:hypothetical protein